MISSTSSSSSSSSPAPDIFEVYSRFCEIESQSEHGRSRDRLAALSKSLGTSHAQFNDLHKLMACHDFSVDSHKFSCFYDFVFFICRENGQKSITVNKALAAWRLVLRGRFRLLNRWCDFVEKYQRHNISEDTWHQLLAFSRCVYEDLEGYDPRGAWPVLIDDFVDYMYRTGYSTCSTRYLCCNCRETGYQHSISNTLRGLKLLPGSKRKSFQNVETEEEARSSRSDSDGSHVILRCKRSRQVMDLDMNPATSNSTINVVDTRSDIHNPIGPCCINNSFCTVERCFSKVSNGHLNPACCFHYGKKAEPSTC